MARITASSERRVYKIQKWLGLNESPDGDTGLKMGEAAEMRNFRITRENHLQIRPGTAKVCTLAEGRPVRGLWDGHVAGKHHLLCACGGHLWDVDPLGWKKTDLGAIHDAATAFFGFSGKVYLLTGSEYYAWDGVGAVAPVEGYIPIVVTAAPPAGGGTVLEQVNKLTGKKRQECSPDGEATVFQLAEANIDQVLEVKGTDLKYTVDTAKGQVSFASAPPKGVNSIVITWRKGNGDRAKVTGMRFSEFYNGTSDSRVFLYGDGTNAALFSGLDENGTPTAEYFPDYNVMAVGESNTPITGMIRHYDRLIVFKSDSAHAAQYGTLSLATGAVIAAFYANPLNREIGCGAPGQICLVDNNPRSLFGRACYEWALSGASTRDERNAKRISDRVESTLTGFDFSASRVFHDEGRREYYIFWNDTALVHNYGCNAWYYYTGLPVEVGEVVDGEVYFGTHNGEIMHFSRNYRNDRLIPIDCYWESGSMDFEVDWRKKYSSAVWMSMKPESQGRVRVAVQSNRKSDYPEKLISTGLASMLNTSFAHWSFGTNRKPQMRRVRMKVKKFTYYKLVITSLSASATATVLAVDVSVRYTGDVK